MALDDEKFIPMRPNLARSALRWAYIRLTEEQACMN